MGSLYSVSSTDGSITTAGAIKSTSTTQGFQPPSMTTTQRLAIPTPADGLIVYDTTLHQLWEFQNGAWAEVGGGSGITQLTGDVTAGPGSGSQASTLATVNSNVGSFTNANITVNAKGLITAAANGSGGGSSSWKSPVGPATTGPLSNTPSYANGSGGVGATLTATSNGALVVDGVTVGTNNRVLVKDQVSLLQNGVYTVTNPGSTGSAAFVQVASNSSNGPSSITITLSPTSVGNLVVVAVDWVGTQTISTVMDNQSNSYTLVPNSSAGPDGVNDFSQIYYLKNCPAGITSVTVTWNAGAAAAVIGYEFSGIATVNALDTSGNVATTASPVSPTLTPTASSDLFLVTGKGGAANLTGVNAPWVIHTESTSVFGSAAYLISSDSSAQTATFTPTGSQTYVASGAAFFAASLGSSYVLTRATDFDTPSKAAVGAVCAVTSGSTNSPKLWMQKDNVSTIGTDALEFANV